jgi:NADH-quinone oxidoreductase subunit I
MTNFYEMADDNRQDLIYTKGSCRPLLPGMGGRTRCGWARERDYYVRARRWPSRTWPTSRGEQVT